MSKDLSTDFEYRMYLSSLERYSRAIETLRLFENSTFINQKHKEYWIKTMQDIEKEYPIIKKMFA